MQREREHRAHDKKNNTMHAETQKNIRHTVDEQNRVRLVGGHDERIGGIKAE